MYHYLIIDAKIAPNDQWSFVADFLAEMLHIHAVASYDTSYHLIYTSTQQLDFKDIIYNMIAETYQDLRAYQSHAFNDLETLEKHKTYVSELLSKLPFNVATYINDRILLRHFLDQGVSIDASVFLGKYAHNSEMLLTLKTFLEHNQHINQTASELYIHRNTLLQRLDKFHQVTGFDVKKFQDAHVIYRLL